MAGVFRDTHPKLITGICIWVDWCLLTTVKPQYKKATIDKGLDYYHLSGLGFGRVSWNAKVSVVTYIHVNYTLHSYYEVTACETLF